MSVVLRSGITGGFLLRSRDSSSVITRRRISSVGATTGRSVNPTAAVEQRATWLPGLERPSYLDGNGDYGFDPLGLGENPKSLKWYVQAELVHSRFAMLGVAGILFIDLLRTTAISNLLVWYEAGAMKFAETKRYMDVVSPGSQAAEGSLHSKGSSPAMMAMLGFFVQASMTHTGPIDNLVEHLSNPWHKTIIQILFTSSS